MPRRTLVASLVTTYLTCDLRLLTERDACATTYYHDGSVPYPPHGVLAGPLQTSPPTHNPGLQHYHTSLHNRISLSIFVLASCIYLLTLTFVHQHGGRRAGKPPFHEPSTATLPSRQILRLVTRATTPPASTNGLLYSMSTPSSPPMPARPPPSQCNVRP